MTAIYSLAMRKARKSAAHLDRGAAIAFVVTIIIVAFVVLSALFLSEKKHSIEKRVELLTSNFVGVIDEQVSASIDKVDLLLLELTDQLQAQLAKHKRVDMKAIDASMEKALARVPELDGLRVVDANGAIIAFAGLQDKVGVSIADREYFRVHQASSGNDLIVSKPLVGRMVDRWMVPLSRKYLNPDGSFAGVVVAPIPVSHFTQVLSRLDLGPGGVAAIRDRELALVTRYPATTGERGTIGSKAVSPEFTDFVFSGSPQGTFHAAVPSDGVKRIASYRLLKRTPYVVLASVAEDYYLADWRNDVRKTIVLDATVAVIVCLSGLLLWWIKRQQAREGALATTVLENAARES